MSSQIKKNLSVLVLADAISKLLPLLTFPYITRVLGPEVYGKYGFAMNVVAFLTLLASPGFVPYGIRAVAQQAGGEARLGAKINGIRLLFTMVALALLILYTFTFAPADGQIRKLLMICALVMIPGALNLDWLLTGRSLITPVAVATIFSQVVYTGFVLAFVTSNSSAWLVPFGVFVGEVVCVLIVYYAAGRNFGLAWPRFTISDFKEIVPTSLLLGFASLMSLTYDKVDTIILSYFRPFAEVGVYTATYKIMWMVMSFQPILARVFFPLIAASSGSAEQGKDARLYLKILFFAAFPLMAGGIALAQPLTQLVIGRQYAGSGLLFSLLLPNVLAGGLSSYYAGMKLVALNRNKEYVIAVAAGAVINLVLNVVFIPFWGALAAAVMTCVSQFAVAGVAAWYGRGDGSASVWSCAVKPLWISLVMVAVIVAVTALFPNLHVLCLVAIGAAVYCALWKADLKVRPA